MNGKHGVGRVLALAVLAAGCAAGSAESGGPEREQVIGELMELHSRADYFALRDALDTLPELDEPRVALLRAATSHAFNRPEQSNASLSHLGDEVLALPDPLQVIAYRLRFRNHLRLHEYAAAAEVATAMLRLPALDSAARSEVENEARIARALADAPAQRVVRRADTEIQLREDGRMPVLMGDSARHFIFDTGANISVLTRSEADALGIAVRPAEVEVGTPTGATVKADVAVAPRVRLGEIELADVAFLVLPDAALTFGDLYIPGIIGFPVIDALGEVEFRRGGVLRVPGRIPERAIGNLAMEFLMPLVQVEVLGEEAVCDLDTGADASSLHLPFYERMRARIDAEGRADTVGFAGAAGVRRMPAYVLEDVRVAVGDTAVVLTELPTYTESATTGDGTPRDCRIGQDVLRALGGYLINLRSMTLLPH